MSLDVRGWNHRNEVEAFRALNQLLDRQRPPDDGLIALGIRFSLIAGIGLMVGILINAMIPWNKVVVEACNKNMVKSNLTCDYFRLHEKYPDARFRIEVYPCSMFAGNASENCTTLTMVNDSWKLRP
jgi:hypothetical protein